MKNRFSKIFVAALAIALVLGATFALMASAETNPEIISNNIQYGEKFSIMYAVDADTVADGAVTLAIYTQTPAEGVDPVKTYTVAAPQTETIRGEEKSVYVFITDGVRAQDFADVFYAQAIDAAGKKSDVVSYSVVEYMLERLYGGQEISAKQEKLYKEAIDFGAAAQKLLASDDAIKVTDYKYVRVEGGTVNGVTGGMFMKGDKLTLALTAAVPQGGFFFGWKNVNGEDDNYSVNEFTLSESAVITADIDANGSRGYFEKLGGYDFTGYTSIVPIYNAGIIKHNTGKLNTNQNWQANAASGNFEVFNQGENVTLRIGAGSNWTSNAYFDCFIPSGDNELYVFESDIYFGDFSKVTDGYAAITINFCGSDNTVYDSLEMKVKTVDGVKVCNVLGYEVSQGTWLNVAIEYDAKSGVARYYFNGRLASTKNTTVATEALSHVRINHAAYACAWTLFDDMCFTNVDKHLVESDEYYTFNDGKIPSGISSALKSNGAYVEVVDVDGISATEKVLTLYTAPNAQDKLFVPVKVTEGGDKLIVETKYKVVYGTKADTAQFQLVNDNETVLTSITIGYENGVVVISDFYNDWNDTTQNYSFSNVNCYIAKDSWVDLRFESYVVNDAFQTDIYLNGEFVATSKHAGFAGTQLSDITYLRYLTFTATDANVYFDDLKVAVE